MIMNEYFFNLDKLACKLRKILLSHIDKLKNSENEFLVSLWIDSRYILFLYYLLKIYFVIF